MGTAAPGGETRLEGMHFERNEANPLDADVVIIDEVSMVDISLMHSLLKAVNVGTRLILVGDVNQLPQRGAGKCPAGYDPVGKISGGDAHKDLPPGGPERHYRKRP